MIDDLLDGIAGVAGDRGFETRKLEAVGPLVGEAIGRFGPVLVRYGRIYEPLRLHRLRRGPRTEAELEPVVRIPGVAEYDVKRDLHRASRQGAAGAGDVERDGLVAQAKGLARLVLRDADGEVVERPRLVGEAL